MRGLYILFNLCSCIVALLLVAMTMLVMLQHPPILLCWCIRVPIMLQHQPLVMMLMLALVLVLELVLPPGRMPCSSFLSPLPPFPIDL